MSQPLHPRTSSTVPPILQQTSRLDSPENPEIMSSEEEVEVQHGKGVIWRDGYRIPLIRLRFNDVCDDGSSVIFDSGLNLHDVLVEAVIGVLDTLYTPKTAPTNVRSVTFIIRSMDGVAYTTGMDIDDDHKEIHFSTDYIAGVNERSKGKQNKQEILGVIRHEMVHCFQYNAFGGANGGLIEGIADWVRYKAGFRPPHWHRGEGDAWDNGYERTAYFLLWLEEQYGPETVPRINGWMKNRHYSDKLFIDLFHEKPEDLFKKYKKWCEEHKEEEGSSEACGTGEKESNPSDGEEASAESSPQNANEGDDHSYVEVSEPPEDCSVSELKLVARDRLCNLTYDGTGSFKRFLNSFEGLIEVLDSKMSEKERKLLLVTAFKGNALAFLDNIDPEDELEFSEIKVILEANNLAAYKS
ncbi:hypothetical protein TWF970_003557 [Orbilia oligospora]|uniref:Plant basic secretory protein n=1 Tax=Orbilia oligospora TaxID=2813651 RepID=A0A7C8VFD3_ORBOL|nr:hypothetical protein TWF970_003557 [Orbilia oligospora]